MLRRLDRIVETGRATPAISPLTSQPPALSGGWPDVLEALETDSAKEALALLGGGEVDEVDNPPNRPPGAAESADLERLTEDIEATIDEESVWWDEDTQCWWTSFPPPEGFAGDERGEWDGDDDEEYRRECTGDEAAILEANSRRTMAREQAARAARRDRFFAALAAAAKPEEGAQA